jgi:hypothetical protein
VAPDSTFAIVGAHDMATYFSEVVMMSVHTTSDRTPSAAVGVTSPPAPFDRGLEGMERTGAHVAIDDAKRPNRHDGALW